LCIEESGYGEMTNMLGFAAGYSFIAASLGFRATFHDRTLVSLKRKNYLMVVTANTCSHIVSIVFSFSMKSVGIIVKGR
jgi:hypothetical protein